MPEDTVNPLGLKLLLDEVRGLREDMQDMRSDLKRIADALDRPQEADAPRATAADTMNVLQAVAKRQGR
ncbi:hypothetical protein [Deinococcus phoenicis]|uniref:hypothetical protein n=1 Tax=Deinococcus phoenicis TaxID=1476583 RepID=UPI0005560808|nr:hypothetical protein [Deinococcus phoenicis]